MSTAAKSAPHSGDREEWLKRVAKEVEPWYDQQGYPLGRYRIGVGFPSSGRKGKAVGECWASDASGDKTCEIFIHPGRDNPIEVAATLVHELVHAAIGQKAGHGPLFKRVAMSLGLEGPMRCTYAGEVLERDIQEIIEKVGPYPHAALNTQGDTAERKKQTGRMLKVYCPECEYICRISKSCIEIGTPPCPNPDCSISYQVHDEIIPMLVAVPKEERESEEG
jgi:hypothetical protein